MKSVRRNSAVEQHDLHTARENQMHNYWLSSNTAGRDVRKPEVTNVILLKSSTILESINTSLCDRRALTVTLTKG